MLTQQVVVAGWRWCSSVVGRQQGQQVAVERPAAAVDRSLYVYS